MDQQASHGNCPIYTTAKPQTQGLSIKDPQLNPLESKSSAFLYTKQSDSSNKAKKKKKKK